MRSELTKLYRVFLFDTEEHYDELIDVLTAALAREPRNVVALGNRGLAYCEVGLVAEALEDFAAAIAIDPSLSDVLMNRAGLLRKLSRHEEALRDCSAAIDLEPANACYRR